MSCKMPSTIASPFSVDLFEVDLWGDCLSQRQSNSSMQPWPVLQKACISSMTKHDWCSTQHHKYSSVAAYAPVIAGSAQNQTYLNATFFFFGGGQRLHDSPPPTPMHMDKHSD